MTSQSRHVQQEDIVQGADETIRYYLDVSNWDDGPTDIVVHAYDETDAHGDVSDEVLVGDAEANGALIALPALTGLSAGHRYRIEVSWRALSGDVYECWFGVLGER